MAATWNVPVVVWKQVFNAYKQHGPSNKPAKSIAWTLGNTQTSKMRASRKMGENQTWLRPPSWNGGICCSIQHSVEPDTCQATAKGANRTLLGNASCFYRLLQSLPTLLLFPFCALIMYNVGRLRQASCKQPAAHTSLVRTPHTSHDAAVRVPLSAHVYEGAAMHGPWRQPLHCHQRGISGVCDAPPPLWRHAAEFA